MIGRLIFRVAWTIWALFHSEKKPTEARMYFEPEEWPVYYDFAESEKAAVIDGAVEYLLSRLDLPWVPKEVTEKAIAREREVYANARVVGTSPGVFWLIYDAHLPSDRKTGPFPTPGRARQWFLEGGR